MKFNFRTCRKRNSYRSENMNYFGKDLYLGNLSVFCVEQDIRNAFHKFGAIDRIRLLKGKEGTHLGYAFITFSDPQSVSYALEMDGEILLGKPLK
jgi:RNA recognition motif-containing protein